MAQDAPPLPEQPRYPRREALDSAVVTACLSLTSEAWRIRRLPQFGRLRSALTRTFATPEIAWESYCTRRSLAMRYERRGRIRWTLFPDARQRAPLSAQPPRLMKWAPLVPV